MTVIELQNDIIAHYGLALDKARLPSLSLLRKLWSLLAIKDNFSEKDFTSKHWKDLGFSGEDPMVDMKRVGILGLRHLSYYGERWPDIVTEKIKLARDKKNRDKVRIAAREEVHIFIPCLSLSIYIYMFSLFLKSLPKSLSLWLHRDTLSRKWES